MKTQSFPEGFRLRSASSGFSYHNGPIYHGADGKIYERGIIVEKKHCNAAGVAHGGMLMALADSAMGGAAYLVGEGAPTLTLQMHAQFLKTIQEGWWLEARAETEHSTPGMIFCKASLYAKESPQAQKEQTVLRAGGVFRRLRKDRADAFNKVVLGSKEEQLRLLKKEQETRKEEKREETRALDLSKDFRAREVRSPFLGHNGPIYEKIKSSGNSYELAMPLLERHCNGMGIAHGGMLMTLADCAMIGALIARGVPRPVYTVQTDMRFLDVTKIGQNLHAVARVERQTGHLGFCSLEMRNERRKVLLGSGVFRLKSDAGISSDLPQVRE